MIKKFKKFFFQIINFELTFQEFKIIIKAFIKGTFYIIWFRLFRKNVKIKFPFMVYGRVTILGEGSVFIDKMCSVYYNIHEGLTIITLSPQARVHIGMFCDLAGLTIRCNNSVKIGDYILSASCLIQDVMQINRKERLPCPIDINENKEISIGNRVWLCALSCVLSGAVIDDGSVLSIGSCIYEKQAKGTKLIIGNPVKKMIPINRLLGLKGF